LQQCTYVFIIIFKLILLNYYHRSRRGISLSVPSNLSPSALHQLLSSNPDPDHDPESGGGDDSLLREVKILRNEVNELREKYGELKGKLESLPDLINRDLNRFKDDFTNSLNNSLVQRFAEADRNIVQRFDSLRSDLVTAMQNMQVSINQVYNDVHNNPSS